MRDYIFFDTKNLSDYKTFVTNAGVYSTPASLYESNPVPGKNGNLLIEEDRFDNVDHSYPVIIEDFDRNFSALKSYLLSTKGYKRLSDTFFPDEFYLAKFKAVENISQKFLGGAIGSCVLVFDRKPQRFLKIGEKKMSVSSGVSLKNPTPFNALPLIRVHGSGTLTISNISITVNTQKSYLDIDCDLQEVLQTGGNLDITLANGEFPKLKSGLNAITYTGFSAVEITPRWWKL